MKSPKTRRQRQISRGINFYKLMQYVENRRQREQDASENTEDKKPKDKTKDKKIVPNPTNRSSKAEKEILTIADSKDRATIRLGKIIKYLNDN